MEELKRRFNVDTVVEEGYVTDTRSGEQVSNNRIRFTCYKIFTYEKFGHLGKGNQMKIPDCAESSIKALFPNIDGNYTNFNATSI